MSDHKNQESFMIKVVDAETGRGIPLVKLMTTKKIKYYTDSAGYVAFDEPGLMNQKVFFYIPAMVTTFHRISSATKARQST